jgi:hypothetical protein
MMSVFIIEPLRHETEQLIRQSATPHEQTSGVMMRLSGKLLMSPNGAGQRAETLAWNGRPAPD